MDNTAVETENGANGDSQAAKKRPTYREMITTAIKELKDRGGSSRVAIDKYIASRFEVQNQKQYIRASLAKGLKDGHFKLVKGTTYRGYYKLGDVEKKSVKKKKAVKRLDSTAKATPKKAAVKKSVSAGARKKPVAKPAAAKKAKESRSPKKAAGKATLKKATPKRPSAPKTKSTPKRPSSSKSKTTPKRPGKAKTATKASPKKAKQ